jgi:hypothetical protein
MEPGGGESRAQNQLQRNDDRVVSSAWTALAETQPNASVVTKTGLVLTVQRTVTDIGRVECRGFLDKHPEPLAWMECMMLAGGRVQVMDAKVYDIGGVDYRPHGIATAIYDLIERDACAAGGKGIEPDFR